MVWQIIEMEDLVKKFFLKNHDICVLFFFIKGIGPTNRKNKSPIFSQTDFRILSLSAVQGSHIQVTIRLSLVSDLVLLEK